MESSGEAADPVAGCEMMKRTRLYPIRPGVICGMPAEYALTSVLSSDPVPVCRDCAQTWESGIAAGIVERMDGRYFERGEVMLGTLRGGQ